MFDLKDFVRESNRIEGIEREPTEAEIQASKVFLDLESLSSHSSGRMLWLWMMGGIKNTPLGFLHHFYYQALDSSRGTP